MFTGIVAESGSVNSVKSEGDGLRLEIRSKTVAGPCDIGDSISVNGVCLTVVSKASGVVGFDVMAETLSISFWDTSIVLERSAG
jgi:riboflavin synthase